MKTVLRLVLALVAIAILFFSTRPSTFHIERSGSLPGSPAAVYAAINDLHAWDAWSPWAHLDPTMKSDYSGPDSGVGASYHWVGNSKVGEGRMTITESQPSERVVLRLEFLKPFPSTNTTTFTLIPAGGGTVVKWAMDGHNNFMAKVMCTFFSMDKMVGPDFERGIAGLATAVPAAADSANAEGSAGAPSSKPAAGSTK